MQTLNSDVRKAQPEDYREILAWIARGNWVAIAGAVCIELFIRSSAHHDWPHWGSFSLIYNLVLIEFALVNLGVTLMLKRTAWLDRAPREALARLHTLLVAVLVLTGLHLLGFVRLTGGIQGPAMVLLPPVLMSVFLLMRHRNAKITTALLLGALLLDLLVGTITNTSQGMLAEAFSPGHESPAPWLLVVAVSVLLALVVGLAASSQMEKADISMQHRLARDPMTGLFAREVLERRVNGELGRIGRSESSAALLLISFRNLPELFAHGDYSGFEALMGDFTSGLLGATRGTSDTCARYDTNTLAALLPTANAETVSLVVKRIHDRADAIREEGASTNAAELAIGVACASAASQTDAVAFMGAAEQALQEALQSDQGHQVVVREL